jgi:hypothetical protein
MEGDKKWGYYRMRDKTWDVEAAGIKKKVPSDEIST